jgi:DNA repair protein RecO (recombination protein O)
MLKTNGFIIRKIPYGDNSAILRVFTREEGLMSFIVHGMQRKQGSNAPRSQLMNHVSLVYYPGGYSSLLRVKEIQASGIYAPLFQDPIKVQVLLFCAELLNLLLEERAADPSLFIVLEEFYSHLNQAANYSLSPLWFLLNLLKNQGMAPHLHFGPQTIGFDPNSGNMILEETLIDRTRYLGLPGCHLAKQMLDADYEELIHLQSTAEVRAETLDQMQAFCEQHLLQGKRLKSVEIIREVLRQ